VRKGIGITGAKRKIIPPCSKMIFCAAALRNSNGFASVAWAALIIVALFSGVGARAASRLDDLFDSANRLYEQSKFSDAVTAYEGIVRTGYVSAPVYFNLGNAYFKSGQIGRAIEAYRIAERLAPRDPDIRANLAFARNQVQGPTFRPTALESWPARLTLNEWTGLAALAFWIWLVVLMMGQLQPPLRPSLRGTRITAGFATGVLVACALAALHFQSRSVVVVPTAELVVRNGPLDDSPEAFTAHDGAELRVIDHKDNWIEVATGSQRTGWVKQEQVLPM
jgi:hypothetical protein